MTSAFSPMIDYMLYWIKLVFNRLKQFNLTIKPKIYPAFILVYFFWVKFCQPKVFLLTQKKLRKQITGLYPKISKRYNPCLGLASYCRQFTNQLAKKVQCLHELMGPTSNKNKKKARTKKNTTTVTKLELRIFKRMTKHQDVSDALKETLSTAPALGYANLSRDFILETDMSLNGLVAILSQCKDGKIHMIAYTSHSLCPSERSMCNYSLAKLELLVLRWAVIEKFLDYLLSSQFQVYMDNNPLNYVQEKNRCITNLMAK